jgi:hypothetical protein
MLTENFSVMENLELTQEEKDHLKRQNLLQGFTAVAARSAPVSAKRTSCS